MSPNSCAPKVQVISVKIFNGQDFIPTFCFDRCRKKNPAENGHRCSGRGNCSRPGMHGLRSLLREAARQETCGSAESVFAADPPFFPRGFNLLLCESLILLCPSFNYLYKPAEMGIYMEYVNSSKSKDCLRKLRGRETLFLDPDSIGRNQGPLVFFDRGDWI